MGTDDVEACLSMGAKTVQIGTKALLEGTVAIKELVQPFVDKALRAEDGKNAEGKKKGFSTRYAEFVNKNAANCAKYVL